MQAILSLPGLRSIHNILLLPLPATRIPAASGAVESLHERERSRGEELMKVIIG